MKESEFLKQNNQLKELKGIDLRIFLDYIMDYYIVYRNSLLINKDITFGVEIEYDNADFRDINKALVNMKKKINNIYESKDHKNYEIWFNKIETSINELGNGFVIGGEVVSPILRDELKSWKELSLVCDMLKKNNATTSSFTAGHIHIGSDILEDNAKYWSNFLKLWCAYENVIFRFGYGENKGLRFSSYEYSNPIRIKILDKLKDINNAALIKENPYGVTSLLGVNRDVSLNLKNYNQLESKNTIEFRCPNGTLNPIIWQNMINFFIKFTLYAKSSLFDEEKIDKRLNNLNCNLDSNQLCTSYQKVNLGDALSLADMIFDNNTDKVSFLRQYLKDYQVCNKFNETIELTKRKKFL